MPLLEELTFETISLPLTMEEARVLCGCYDALHGGKSVAPRYDLPPPLLEKVVALAERGLVVINSALASEFLLMKAILVVRHMDCGFVTFFDCSFVYRSAAGLFGKRKSVRGRQDMGNL